MKLINSCWVLLIGFGCIGSSFADEWKSPNGVISVERPDSSKFTEMQPGASFLVAWIGKGDPIQMGVVQVSVPKGIAKINQKSAEEGFKNECSGTITQSSHTEIGGYAIYKMTAEGDIQGHKMFCTQYLLAEVLDGQCYKIMATSIGKDELNNPDVKKFLDSFKILRAHDSDNASNESNHAGMTRNSDPQKSLTDTISQKLGGACLLLLIVGLIVLWFNKKQKNTK